MRSHFGKLMFLTSVLSGLVALISMPAFDPGNYRGGWFGMVIMGLWAWSLFVWTIGSVRRNGSRVRTRTVLVAAIALALMFGAFPWLPFQTSVRLGFAAISAAMVYEAWRDGGWLRPVTTRLGRFNRIALSSAGLLGLAVVIRDWLSLMGVG